MAYAQMSGTNGLIINNGSSNTATITTNTGAVTCTGLTVYNNSAQKIAVIDSNAGTLIYNTLGTNAVATITTDGSFSSTYGGQVGSTTAITYVTIPIPYNQISLLTATMGGVNNPGYEQETSLLIYNVNFTSSGIYSAAIPLTLVGFIDGRQYGIVYTVSSDYSSIKLTIPQGTPAYALVFSMICLGGPAYNTNTSSFAQGFNT